jgi:hypothetical protein
VASKAHRRGLPAYGVSTRASAARAGLSLVRLVRLVTDEGRPALDDVLKTAGVRAVGQRLKLYNALVRQAALAPEGHQDAETVLEHTHTTGFEVV